MKNKKRPLREEGITSGYTEMMEGTDRRFCDKHKNSEFPVLDSIDCEECEKLKNGK